MLVEIAEPRRREACHQEAVEIGERAARVGGCAHIGLELLQDERRGETRVRDESSNRAIKLLFSRWSAGMCWLGAHRDFKYTKKVA